MVDTRVSGRVTVGVAEGPSDIELGAGVADICPGDPQAGKAVPQPGQHEPGPVPVLDVSGMHCHRQQ